MALSGEFPLNSFGTDLPSFVMGQIDEIVLRFVDFSGT